MGQLLFILQIVVPVLLFLATVLILQVFTYLDWRICAIIGIFVALFDVFVIMPFTEKSAQDSIK